MNPTQTLQSATGDAANERVARIFAMQQAAFLAAPSPSASERLDRLKALKRQITRYQDVLAEAMSQDFGHRAHAESKMLDLLGSMMEVNHAISHLKRWMKPSRRSTELLFITNSVKVIYQPKGVVGVITPWNFPIYLALGPAVAALAAGNRVMIKMPETTPATNAVLKKLLAEVFSEDLVAMVGEELLDPNVFTSQPFNHIVFTGSPAVGKIVMRTAAANLTPVTLELGGKSPALVTRNYSVADAAKRITHGKSTNAGQICVSPDYALVPRERMAEFIVGVRQTFKSFYDNKTADNPNYTSVVDERQFKRINALLADARAKGATVESLGPVPVGKDRTLPLQIVSNVTPDMLVMKEELFGPVLPVVPYDTMDDAINFINERDRPLALYCFSHDSAERDNLLRRTHSGGVSINDWGWHVVNHDAPFGGIGNSGMGNYHGEEGFRELSHAKTVFKRHRFFPIDLFYPPYGTFIQRFALKFFLGSPDPSLGQPGAAHGAPASATLQKQH
ncbi:coniferyl aldehyde dehydrogenase [Variovorax sp. J22R133]|uniref:coniferyl aldehyde dehydrogenase n=1 Tax=Variovorax brevis TaxID=3053503 RepID=UPI002577DEF2|nr:coniferyl aldehyde dehydrogenase [Variovorax sp. J22R133]MDM0114971.1 coniferyl aldehyde dehydrogenase [Variovorax sp. J22R133]